MKVLVTGGNGLIGAHTVERLLAHGREPVVFDRRAGGSLRGDRRFEVEAFLGDITDAVAVTEAIAHVDAFVHLAGVLGTQETIQNPRPSATINIMGGLNVLEAAAHHKPPGVYLSVGNHWIDNSYSISEAAVERYTRMYNAYRAGRTNAVRAVNVYGEGQQASPPSGRRRSGRSRRPSSAGRFRGRRSRSTAMACRSRTWCTPPTRPRPSYGP